MCPYCHSENKEVAEKQKKEILTRYDREAENMKKTLPQKAIHKGTKWLLIAAGVLVGIIIIVSLIVIVGAKISVKLEYQKRNDQIAQMEELLVTKD